MAQEVVTTAQGTAPARWSDGGEALWQGIVARPATDIFETADHVVVVADMPGVAADAVDITLERRTLTLRGRVQADRPENYRRVYAEHDIAGFERVFMLSQDIDRDHIDASISNGVLTLKLPKAEAAKTKKINVNAA